MAGKFVLKKGSTGKYHFNLVASNGQVIATSEAYERKQSALNGIEWVKNNARRGDSRPDGRRRRRLVSVSTWPRRPRCTREATARGAWVAHGPENPPNTGPPG